MLGGRADVDDACAILDCVFDALGDVHHRPHAVAIEHLHCHQPHVPVDAGHPNAVIAGSANNPGHQRPVSEWISRRTHIVPHLVAHAGEVAAVVVVLCQVHEPVAVAVIHVAVLIAVDAVAQVVDLVLPDPPTKSGWARSIPESSTATMVCVEPVSRSQAAGAEICCR